MAIAVALLEGVPDGVGLVAVGDDGLAVKDPNGVIDDETGILHLGRVKGLGADAVLGDGEDAVAAVDAATHDKIGDDRLAVVGGAAQDDAAAGIGVAAQFLCDVQNLHR